MTTHTEPAPLVAEVLAATDSALITGLKVLTHRIHECNGNTIADYCDGPCRDLRIQRDAIETELLRRLALCRTLISEPTR